MAYRVLQGNNIDVLKKFPDNHFDSIVTDPPYGIDFLGKAWDANTGALETYQECFRVLKPGGHILAFSAARTYHHLAITLEQAGFEIRDQIMWIYSSGFPKSQDVGKNNSMPDWIGWGTNLKPAHEPIALARKPIKISIAKNCQQWGVGALNIDACRVPYAEDDTLEEWKQRYPDVANGSDVTHANFNPEKRTNKDKPKAGKRTASFHNATGGGKTQSGGDGSGGWEASNVGRFPSNVIGEIPEYQKYFYCPKVSRAERHVGHDNPGPQTARARDSNGNVLNHAQKLPGVSPTMLAERLKNSPGNNHPTVKPIDLMRYLIKLVTPAGGHVLDPFNGSGSTGCAAVELDYDYTGIELDAKYVDIARKRIEAWYQETHPNNFTELFEEL